MGLPLLITLGENWPVTNMKLNADPPHHEEISVDRLSPDGWSEWCERFSFCFSLSHLCALVDPRSASQADESPPNNLTVQGQDGTRSPSARARGVPDQPSDFGACGLKWKRSP